MVVRSKAQRDYLLTESSIDLPASVSEVDDLLRATKTSGKMVVLYNGGCVQGINIEQKTKMKESDSVKIRPMLDIDDKVI
jgi:hypothetical protein